MNRSLSTKTFIISMLLILLACLGFIAGLDYIFNIQYRQKNGNFLSGNGPVTSAPVSLVLSLDQPDDDSLTFQQSLVVSGKTSSDAQILISTDSQDTVVEPKNDNTFSTILTLKEGVNNLDVYAFDKTGEQRSISKTVYYSKEQI